MYEKIQQDKDFFFFKKKRKRKKQDKYKIGFPVQLAESV